jgi:PAS domain S-box-containing protein
MIFLEMALSGQMVCAYSIPGALLLLTASIVVSYLVRRRSETKDPLKVCEAERGKIEERLAAILSSIGDGVICTDVAGNVTVMNSVAERLTGWTREDARGHPVREVFPLGDEQIRGEMEITIHPETDAWQAIGRQTFTALGASGGAKRRITAGRTSICGSRGGVIGTVLVIRDVTQEHERLTRLRESRERFALIAKQSREIIWEVDQEGVYTYISRACSTLLGYSSDEVVGKLHFYDLHPAEGREEFRRKAFEVFERKMPFTDFHNLVVAKDGQVLDVLTNLTGNAIKFTARGEVVIRMGLVSETDDAMVVRFSVRDSGIGIPKDKQGMLFRPFTQVDASTTRKYGGTGLGLAISRHLVELMGGEMGMTSEAGKGSEFWFTVRVSRSPGPKGDGISLEGLHGVSVLVVDDTEANREIMTTWLRSWGGRAAEAADGPAALEALRRAKNAGDPFHVAFLDMEMPGMDGETLARAIGADEDLKGTRLVLMHGLGQQADARGMQSLGIAACMTKPVRQPSLFDTLSQVLSCPSSRKAAPASDPCHPPFERRRNDIRILLAEDIPINQKVAISMLKKLHLGADVVASGAEAIGALGKSRYDLVLMDVQMPEMDGIEATRRIRDPRSPVLDHTIPIIAMTAHAMKGDREMCLAAGMSDYISKPITFASLKEALQRWLTGEGRSPGPLPEACGPDRADSPQDMGCRSYESC